MTMQELFDGLGVDVAYDAPLADLTWYRVGGPAKALVNVKDVEQLGVVVRRCFEKGVKVFLLGAGANLLVRDEGVDGVVVRLTGKVFGRIEMDGGKVVAGGGVDLAKLIMTTAGVGLSGLEGLAGIPATVGGAVRMNAGGAFGEIGDVVTRVRVMGEDGEVKDFAREAIGFGYRTSGIEGLAIVEVEFALAEGDAAECREKVKEVMGYKKGVQPLGAKSSGCIFKNPKAEQFKGGEVKSAGQLIDQAGLKGYRVGGAEVSERHANFVVADEGCCARDIIAVVEHVEEVVERAFGVKLVREIVVW